MLSASFAALSADLRITVRPMLSEPGEQQTRARRQQFVYSHQIYQ